MVVGEALVGCEAERHQNAEQRGDHKNNERSHFSRVEMLASAYVACWLSRFAFLPLFPPRAGKGAADRRFQLGGFWTLLSTLILPNARQTRPSTLLYPWETSRFHPELMSHEPH